MLVLHVYTWWSRLDLEFAVFMCLCGSAVSTSYFQRRCTLILPEFNALAMAAFPLFSFSKIVYSGKLKIDFPGLLQQTLIIVPD